MLFQLLLLPLDFFWRSSRFMGAIFRALMDLGEGGGGRRGIRRFIPGRIGGNHEDYCALVGSNAVMVCPAGQEKVGVLRFWTLSLSLFVVRGYNAGFAPRLVQGDLKLRSERSWIVCLEELEALG